MKVIDIQIYRNRKLVEALEKSISEHALKSRNGSVGVIKTCFKQWITKRTG